MAFYGDGTFYGSGAFYRGATSTANGQPQDLSFYRTSQDGIYTFDWGFLPEFITPGLAMADYELQLDTAASTFLVETVTDPTHLVVSSTAGMADGNSISQMNSTGIFTTIISTIIDGTHLQVEDTTGWVGGGASASLITFASPNLVDYNSTDVITYQNGNVRKGFTVQVAARINGIVQIWYARVRTIIGGDASAWSNTLVWTIPQNTEEEYATNLMLFIPDAHVYGKEDLLKPPSQRNTNLYTVENMYAQQLDAAWYENYLTTTDTFITLTRDENLFGIWGVLFNFPKPTNMQYVDYRWILQNLIAAALVGSTNQAVIDVIQSFTGVPPIITNVRDLNDFTLITIQDDPIIPSGAQTVFHTSESFIGSTLVVEDLTTGLLVPNSAYTTDETQGTWTMHVPTIDTLQATFDIGNPRDPFPIIFDSLSGAIALTGLITFTNGSAVINGSGTLFLSELTIGQQITDPTGIYLGTINNIINDTSIGLTNLWGGPTEVVTGYRLQYTDLQLPPPILWDKGTLAFGVIITILNPGEFNLP